MASNRKERTIIASSIIFSGVLLLRFVPRDKIRNAVVSILFKQVITWLFGLLVVEKNLSGIHIARLLKKHIKRALLSNILFIPFFVFYLIFITPEKVIFG